MRDRSTSAVHRRRLVRSVVVPGVLVLAAAALLLGHADPVRAGEPTIVGRVENQAAIVELGRRLFFEPLASPSSKRSCASCHLPEHGFSDPKKVSDDDFGTTRRHSQTIIDAAHNPNAHWDGEFKNIEELIKGRLSTTATSGAYGGRGGDLLIPGVVLSQPGTDAVTAEALRAELMKKAVELAARSEETEGEENAKAKELETFALGVLNGAHEMLGVDHSAGQQVAKRVQESGRYVEGFHAAFGSSDVTLDKIAKAIATYCRTVEHTESPYDRFAAGEKTAMTAAAKRGLALFEGRAGCNQCHVTEGTRPRLTDFQFHNTGISYTGTDPRFAEIKKELERQLETARAAGAKSKIGAFARSALSDPGRGGVSGQKSDHRRFKTPTLRDVARRGPYMHDARFETLEEVVRYYASGCGEDPEKDSRLKPFDVTDEEVADLVAFLHALTGTERPGLAKTAWATRANTTRVRIVDAAGLPMARTAVSVEPAGDVVPDKDAPVGPSKLMTDAKGWVTFPPRATTHVRVTVPGFESGLVPDTCAQTKVALPVRGRAYIVIEFAGDAKVPESVTVQHAPAEQVSANPGEVITTTFTRLTLAEHEGKQVARYKGWIRTGVFPTGTLDVPGWPQIDRWINLESGGTTRFDLSK